MKEGAGTILFDDDFFKSNSMNEHGKLEKSKKVLIPSGNKRKKHYRVVKPKLKKEKGEAK